MSDAIRLFLRQVVKAGGLPFPVKGGGVRVASGKQLWEMKRASQARDRQLVAQGALSPEDVMLVGAALGCLRRLGNSAPSHRSRRPFRASYTLQP